MGLQPRARIVATAVCGSEPTIMLTGPAPASRKALAAAGLIVEDIDLFEINEAFSSVAMRWEPPARCSSARCSTSWSGGAAAVPW